MVITREIYKHSKNGKDIERFSITNSKGMKVCLLSYGALISEIHVPDRHGNTKDVVTGYDTPIEWEEDSFYFGATVGRVANRIKNGKFSIDSNEFQLPINNGPNHLHGGQSGFNRKIWNAKIIDDSSVEMSYVAADGEEGYPGELTVRVTYHLHANENELSIQFKATTNKATIVNLTNHAYFNLQEHKSANIYNHKLLINADYFTPKTMTNVPSGEIVKVKGTCFDFTELTQLAQRIIEVPFEEGEIQGYDHNFCIKKSSEQKKFAAKVTDEESGRILEVFTTQPGVHFYTANYVDVKHGKDGATYGKHCSFCLETQNYPDAVNHKNFPSSILRPSEEYNETTWFKFSTF